MLRFIVERMPIWFGLFFLGPLMAELVLRTGLTSLLPAAMAQTITTLPLMVIGIVIGGIWGVVAYRYGRWI